MGCGDRVQPLFQACHLLHFQLQYLKPVLQLVTEAGKLVLQLVTEVGQPVSHILVDLVSPLLPFHPCSTVRSHVVLKVLSSEN